MDEKATAKQTDISPDVLYLLMAAEIAGQRNQYDIALDGYLQAAKKVNDARISERAAKIGLFLNNREKTDEAVSLWLKQDSNNLTARKIAVLSAFQNQNKTAAINNLNLILQQDPAGFRSTLMDVLKLQENHQNDPFIFDILDSLIQQHPKQATLFFVQGLLAGQAGQHDMALKKVNQALTLQPDWDKALILRAQLAVQTGDFELAEKSLRTILKNNPEDKRVSKMLAQILLKNKQYKSAINLYEERLKHDPADNEARFAIAAIYLQQDQPDDALVYLKELVNKPAWNSRASLYIGKIEFQKKHYNQALVWFTKVGQGPLAYDAAVATISVLLNQKNFERAKTTLEAMAKLYPKRKTNILLLKAEIYTEQGNNQKAFQILTDALKDHPKQSDLLYTRALIAEKLDRLDILESDLKKMITLYPNDARALNALGYTLVDKTQRYDEAEKYLLQAIKLQPEEAVIIDSLGWLKFKQGKWSQALEQLKIAYQKQPESEIAAHLAEVLWMMGEKSQAKKIFEQAIKKSPEDKYLLSFKQKFLDN